MKTLITFLLFALISISSFSQNELDARIELENAEKEMEKENYKQAVIHLDKAQEYLGNWSGRISYLKIIAMDQYCDYRFDSYWKPLDEEVALYKAYAAKDPDKIDLDKYREIKKIDDLLTAAKHKKSWEEMPEYKTAWKHESDEEYADAMLWYQKAAEKGNAMAMSKIGLLYEEGLGVEKDEVESMKWRERGANEGDIGRAIDLGRKYYSARNFKEAMKWYKKSVAEKAGDQASMYTIGYMYERGYGVTQDYAEAMKWYKKGWGKGNQYCLEKIGKLYQYGHGVEKDYAEALKWYHLALEHDDEDVKYNMGIIYQLGGNGVEKDFAEAMKWYKQSAENEDDGNAAVSTNQVGVLYRTGGFGIERNYEEAAEWHRKSAEKGHDWGMYNIGYMYENGHGVPKDKSEAIKWYKKAADKNHEHAQKALKRLGQ